MKKIFFEKLTIKEKKVVQAGAGTDPASCGPIIDDYVDIPDCNTVPPPEPWCQ